MPMLYRFSYHFLFLKDVVYGTIQKNSVFIIVFDDIDNVYMNKA